MKTLISIFLLFAVVPADAAITFQGQVCTFDRIPINNHILQKELGALGYTINNGLGCRLNKCRMTFADGVVLDAPAKIAIGQAIVNHQYVDLKQRAADRKAAVVSMAQNLKDKPNKTPLEKMVLYLIRQMGLGE